MKFLSPLLMLSLTTSLAAQSIDLPPRPADAATGSELVAAINDLSMEERERRIIAEFTRGNVPSWNRRWIPVEMRRRLGSSDVVVTFWTLGNYVAVGSDEDWFLTPLSPHAATRIGELVGASLPTPLMVDAIWKAARKLQADSIVPSAAMVTVPVFARHNRLVQQRLRDLDISPGVLLAGHKKDVVLTPRLDSLPGRVAIYGWHRPDGTIIQPLYLGHGSGHVDYSHGIRLVRDRVNLDGMDHDLAAVLRDPMLSRLLLNEGPMREGRYARGQ